MAKTAAFRKYVAIPFTSASAAAVLVTAIVVGSKMTGYEGRYQTSGTPVSFAEAWTDVPILAGLIFAVTFLVLAVWAKVRSPTHDHPSN